MDRARAQIQGSKLGASKLIAGTGKVETNEQIKARIEAAVPGVGIEVVEDTSPAQNTSLLLDRQHALAVATFLRDDPELRFDYASNVTGVDKLDWVEQQKRRVTQDVDGEERVYEETVDLAHRGYLEAVYHLYSMAKKHGPLILRVRCGNRTDQVQLPSLTPVWRSCEFQEREIYDLFGIEFNGHPDLRRILMWDGYEDHPMRRDYVDPDDYEYEPTPHDEVLARAKGHYPNEEEKP